MKSINPVSSKLAEAFPQSELLSGGMFIPHTNFHDNFFYILPYEDLFTVQYKILCYIPAYMFPIGVNEGKFKYLLKGINTFLGTNFTTSDIRKIWMFCSGGVDSDSEFVKRFISSNFDINLLNAKYEAYHAYTAI